ncbi:hypothetical protein WR25_14336 isoform H [Diploscapter pachys]|uniref:Nuclear receptor domain-containing protein n=1 Tax=Diploscapter pachys TaxID=2018661 RepID=A0A2A2KHA2_9BILA|nr:hypothetical protein WR25_14336 isoform H [Diploscapter pachys]
MAPERPILMVERQRCVVCSENADGLHFGVSSCRACAAFFRRTVAHDKIYTCRDKSSCDIHTSVRCMCKSCRYEKCLRMGMRKTAVQRNRDAIGKRISNNPSEDQEMSSPCSSNSDKHEEEELVGMNYLNRVSESYEHLTSVRRVVHRNDKMNFLETSHTSRPVRHEECNEQHARDLPLLMDFIVSAFPDFNALERGQKDIIFRNFFLQFRVLECAYFSLLYNRSDVLFTPGGYYIDINDIEGHFQNTNVDKKKEMIEFMRKNLTMFRDTYLNNVYGLLTDKFEFYTLIGMILFDIALEGQSDECAVVCKAVRHRLFSELVYYYKYVKKLPDASIRIATLMQMPPLIQVIFIFRSSKFTINLINFSSNFQKFCNTVKTRLKILKIQI